MNKKPYERKPHKLKKRGDLWYNKLADEDSFHTTRETSVARAEQYVLNLLNELYKFVTTVSKSKAMTYSILSSLDGNLKYKTSAKNLLGTRTPSETISLLKKHETIIRLNYELKKRNSTERHS